MKLLIHGNLVQADGVKLMENSDTKLPLTVKDVLISSILYPIYDAQGKMEDPKKKNEKFKVWEILVASKPKDKKIEIDLTLDQLSLCKSCVEEHQAQLVMGQVLKVLESPNKDEK